MTFVGVAAVSLLASTTILCMKYSDKKEELNRVKKDKDRTIAELEKKSAFIRSWTRKYDEYPSGTVVMMMYRPDLDGKAVVPGTMEHAFEVIVPPRGNTKHNKILVIQREGLS